MQRVHKAAIADADTIVVDGDRGGLLEVPGRPVACGPQDGSSFVWFLTELPEHQVFVTYTGYNVPAGFEHFATWQIGEIVFHAFRRPAALAQPDEFGPLKQG